MSQWGTQGLPTRATYRFWARTVVSARQHNAIARYMLSPVRPSVRLSVTRVDQSKTVKVRMVQPSPEISP